MKTIPLTMTTKGLRVWTQGLMAHGWHAGDTYNTHITPTAIVYHKSTTGKLRKVTAYKGDSVIDTVSQKVTKWAQGDTTAQWIATHDTITVIRGTQI
jgi:hypothetical protein